jgi:uncharacterized membrane protein YhhN
MFTMWFWVTIVMALGDWVSVWKGLHQVRWVTKPGVLFALLLWFTQTGRWQGNLVWFGMAIVFSLAGDVFLLLPRRFFIAGLAAFLTAHLFYVVGFNASPFPLDWGVVITAIAVIAASVMAGQMIGSAARRGENGSVMGKAVTSYIVVISLMVFSALLTLFKPDWPSQASILCSAGAILFWVSDTLLGTQTFIRSYHYSALGVIITYHVGQALMISGVLLAYAR